MIVCHCKVVNDRAIEEHIARGAGTADEIGELCGAGTRCGSCQPTIVAILATRLSPERAQPAA